MGVSALIESGANGPLAWVFPSTAGKFFLRLRFSDIPTSDPFTADFDGDKVSNYDELLFGTDPLVSLDSDLDGLPDDWEKRHFGNLASGATGDPDNDGLSNLEEFAHGTNPKSPDSDSDGLSDGAEVNIHGTDPLKWDSDGDTLPDGWEVQYGLNPLDPTDANQTAAGGGMTNLQHYELGSNPNNPPPPPTITAGTATLDQSAATLLYPANDSQLLFKNGNFSAPSLGSYDWKTYSGITGWTAISGDLIELQKFSSLAIDGQYCELDSHWQTDPHSGDSDHGIQQTVNLARGRYLLFFDYRGRQHSVEAGNFTVKLKNAGSSTDVTLATKNSASTTAWKRASTTFDISGGNPNSTQLPITLQFDSADARDSYGAYIDNVILLPVDIKVHQTKNGPQGSAPKYINAPEAYLASNLFSLWPNEEAIVKVKLPPPFDQQQNLPAGLIKWTVPGHNIPDNTLEAPLAWSLGLINNTKEVIINIGGSEFKLHFKVQGVGLLSELEASALLPNAAPVMLFHRQEAIDYGATFPAGPQQDAMRHSYWCSLSVSTYPVTAGDVSILSQAHEYRNRYDNKQQACSSTMDLKNNDVGTTVNHQVDGHPDRAPIKADLTQKYAAGEMFIWEIPRGKGPLEGESEGILIKSNHTRIFP